MIIPNINTNCICLKNQKKGCRLQCPNKKYIGNYCKKHSKSKFKTIYEYNLVVIQSYIRLFITKCKIHRIYGPAFKNPLLSHDNIDPISLEYIWEIKNNRKMNICEIPRYLIFSYLDQCNRIRVYNILSLLKLIQYDSKDPITRDKLDQKIKENINTRIEFMKSKNLITDVFKNYEKSSGLQKVKNLITDITLLLCHHNIYINNDDIFNLNESKIKQLYSECRCILYHYDNKHIVDKIQHNKKFFQLKIEDFQKIKDITHIQIIIFTEILNTLNLTELQGDIKTLAYIILGAFMYVSPNIYNSYTNNLLIT